MPEPTEGPWSAPPCGAYGQWPVLGPNFEAIAFATTQPGDRWKAAANAHRMAAAPEMLEALEGIVRLTKVQHVLETWELGLLKAAIAKARGGEMTEHTPGPWAVRRRDSLVPSHMIMAPGKDTPIATTRMTGPDTDDYDESEEIANARLMAAAPDMEKALEKIVLEFEGYASDGLDLAIAAIAKARGE